MNEIQDTRDNMNKYTPESPIWFYWKGRLEVLKEINNE